MDSPIILVNGHENVLKGEPWFEDGNIVLVTHQYPTAYRVHRGVLSRHSDIFRDMFGMPQPTHDMELFEGCQIVTMYDLPSDLSYLIKALYDGPTFANQSVNDFFYLAGVLRLSAKYFIEHLRRQAIQFLKHTWPSTLSGHDQMVETALDTASVNGLSYPFVHPLHVLNLAGETNALILKTAAFYFLSLYPLSDILRGDHPKFLVEHPSRPSSELSLRDTTLYTLMYQHRITLLDTFMREFCPERAFKPACGRVPICGKAFSRLVAQLHRSWTLRTGPLHFISQAMDMVSSDQTICSLCRSAFHRDCSKLRHQIWNDLPAVVNLPTWLEMSGMS